MQGVRLTRRTLNKPSFGIRSGSSQSDMPRLHLRTDVDLPYEKEEERTVSIFYISDLDDVHIYSTKGWDPLSKIGANFPCCNKIARFSDQEWISEVPI